MRRPTRTRRATRYERSLLREALRHWKGRPQLKGGLLSREPRKFHRLLETADPDQLAIGVRVEREHVRRPEIALEIAMAHLLENPKYYAILERAKL